MKKGLLGIISGKGKGKTTSALGLAIRAAGWGQKVLFAQFFKGRKTGEGKILAKLDSIDYKQFGSKQLINFENPTNSDKKTFNRAWGYLKKKLRTDDYDLVILDEINLAIYYCLISQKEVEKLIDNRDRTSIILTGRNGEKLEKLLNKADFVSRVENIKHHFDKNISARKGIEY